jgi:glutaminyl-tRNA synthetase
MSKRGLEELISKQIIRGWDDPRIYTLAALRRRGVPAAAILSFINELGVTTAITTIQIARFEQSIRRYLETSVPRLMLVLAPLRVVIESTIEEPNLTIHFMPKCPEMGCYEASLTSTIYIERSDFREVDDKDYFRLAPGKPVGLLNAPFPIKVKSFSKDEGSGKVSEVRAELTTAHETKPKAYIHWVAEGSRKVEARIYSRLFKSDDPKEAEGGYVGDVLPSSEVIYTSAMVSAGFDGVRKMAPWPKSEASEEEIALETIRFQGTRVGYFVSFSVIFSIYVGY